MKKSYPKNNKLKKNLIKFQIKKEQPDGKKKIMNKKLSKFNNWTIDK